MALPLFDASERSAESPPTDDLALPSFTTAIRGYQKEEVHSFLRELRSENGDEARERHRLALEAHDLRQRVAALEHSIASETPHTIDALGERLLLILHHAETAAASAVSEATEQAERISREAAERAEVHVRQASLRASQASQVLNAARTEAQQTLRLARETIAAEREAQLEAAERSASELVGGAQRRADTTVDDAERRADTLRNAAQRQADTLHSNAQRQADKLLADAETYAAELRSEAERAELAARDQISERRALADAQMEALALHREALLAEMGEIHAALARTLRASGFMDPVTCPPAASLDGAGLYADGNDGERHLEREDAPTQEQPVVVG